MNRRNRVLGPVLILLCNIGTPRADDIYESYQFGNDNIPGFPPSGEWSNVENWSPTICRAYGPSGGCIVKDYPNGVNTGELFHVVISPLPGTIWTTTMSLNVPVSLAKLDVNPGVELKVLGNLGLNRFEWDEEGSRVVATTAVLSNNGTVKIGSVSIYSNSGMWFEGGGEYLLAGSEIRANVGWGNTATVHGAGSISGGHFVNEGTIIADFAAVPLEIGAGGLGLNDQPTARNTGTLRATNGAILRLVPTGSSNRVLDNTGGVVEAAAGSTVELLASLRGGRLQGAGTIDFKGAGGFLDGYHNTGTLRLMPGTYVTAIGEKGGTIVNDGTLELVPDPLTGALTTYYIDGAVTIGGSGSLFLRGEKTQVLGGDRTSSLTIGDGTLVHGSGLIGTSTSNLAFWLLANAGTIRADTTGGTLVLRGHGLDDVTDLANHGTLEAAGGGVLEIRSSDVINDGIIRAQAGSVVDVNMTKVIGGSFETIGTGQIKVRSVSGLRDVTNLGTLAILGSQIAGTITNDGNMLLEYAPAAGSFAPIDISGDALLTGAGVLTMQAASGNTATARIQSSLGGVLTNDVPHTIRGTGSIGYGGAMGLRNKGLIEAVGGELTLSADATRGGLVNEGTLRAADGATLRVMGNLAGYGLATHTLSGGRYEARGTIRLPNGTAITRNAADIVLDGAAARLYAGMLGSIDALASFGENLVGGGFSILDGRDFALGVFTNAGNVHVGINSTLSAASYTQTAGKTQIDGKLIVLGQLLIEGGQLGGSGQIAGNLLNAGLISPGNSPGLFEVDGDYVQTGTLFAELGADDHDRLVVTGTATLGGTLQVSLWAAPGAVPYVPTSAVSFDLVFANTLLGTFETVELPGASGIRWGLEYLVDAIGDTDVVRLTASPVPLPPTFGLLLGAIGVLFRSVHRRAGSA